MDVVSSCFLATAVDLALSSVFVIAVYLALSSFFVADVASSSSFATAVDWTLSSFLAADVAKKEVERLMDMTAGINPGEADALSASSAVSVRGIAALSLAVTTLLTARLCLCLPSSFCSTYSYWSCVCRSSAYVFSLAVDQSLPILGRVLLIGQGRGTDPVLLLCHD